MITKYYIQYYTQNLLPNQCSDYYFPDHLEICYKYSRNEEVEDMLEENLGKLLVISRTISQAFYHLIFPASRLSYFKQQLFTLTKILNWKTKHQKSQSPRACSHSQAHRNSLNPLPFRFLDLLPNCNEGKKTCPTVRESNEAYFYFGCLLVLLSLGRVYQTLGLEFTDCFVCSWKRKLNCSKYLG